MSKTIDPRLVVGTPAAVPFAPGAIGPSAPSPSTATTLGRAGRTGTAGLFGTSSYGAAAKVDLGNGKQLSLPTLSQDERAQVDALFGGLDDDSKNKLAAASDRLATALYASAQQAATGGGSQVAQNLATGSDAGDSDSDDDNGWAAPEGSIKGPSAAPAGSASALAAASSGAAGRQRAETVTTSAVAGGTTTQANVAPSAGGLQASVVAPGLSPQVGAAVGDAAATYSQVTGNKSYDQTVQAVSYMGLIGLQGQLTDFAGQVQTKVNATQQTRVDLADLRSAVANWPDDGSTQTFSWTTYDQYGAAQQHTEALTKDQAQATADNLDSQLTGMSDMNQLDQIRLQTLTQNYQQGVNTISNLLKFQFDTVKSIINNIHT